MFNVNSIDLVLIIGTEVIHQGTLTVSGNYLKYIYRNDSDNSLVNVINEGKMTQYYD